MCAAPASSIYTILLPFNSQGLTREATDKMNQFISRDSLSRIVSVTACLLEGAPHLAVDILSSEYKEVELRSILGAYGKKTGRFTIIQISRYMEARTCIFQNELNVPIRVEILTWQGKAEITIEPGSSQEQKLCRNFPNVKTTQLPEGVELGSHKKMPSVAEESFPPGNFKMAVQFPWLNQWSLGVEREAPGKNVCLSIVVCNRYVTFKYLTDDLAFPLFTELRELISAIELNLDSSKQKKEISRQKYDLIQDFPSSWDKSLSVPENLKDFLKSLLNSLKELDRLK